MCGKAPESIINRWEVGLVEGWGFVGLLVFTVALQGIGLIQRE